MASSLLNQILTSFCCKITRLSNNFESLGFFSRQQVHLSNRWSLFEFVILICLQISAVISTNFVLIPNIFDSKAIVCCWFDLTLLCFIFENNWILILWPFKQMYQDINKLELVIETMEATLSPQSPIDFGPDSGHFGKFDFGFPPNPSFITTESLQADEFILNDNLP